MTDPHHISPDVHSGADGYWRELLFWLLLVAALKALGSTSPRRAVAGMIETCGFLFVACISLSKLRTLGLEFVEWNRIGRRVIAACTLMGLVAGIAIIGVARLANQPIGVGAGWNRAVLVIVLGPISEEVIFRGYVLTVALWLTRQLAEYPSAKLSILGSAVLFGLAHIATRGTTGLQFCCAVMTGCLYGWVRIRYRSTVAAALTHGTYNLALYLSCWCGFCPS
jgi:membrane protease YdiL (CAAX protease family)